MVAANTARGELEVRIGGQTRVLRFRTAETMLLQKRLECDVIAYLARQGGTENFLVEAIFCGLSRLKNKKINPMRVAAWLDDDDHPIEVEGKAVSRVELMQEIIYAIGRAKPEHERKEYIEALDDIFGDEDDEVDEAGNGEAASGGDSVRILPAKTSSDTPPPSASSRTSSTG